MAARLRVPPPEPLFLSARAAPMSATAAAELRAEGLACRRGERLVFAGLSFRVPPGGALVLTGSNGSGKTSLLRVAAGLLAPAAGRLHWGDWPIDGDIAAHRARLHYVGHQDAVKSALTPRETLSFWVALHGAAGARPGAVDCALDALGLDDAADWPCRWLSAGQRRRLALARLLAAPAPLWLLDEPTSTLDGNGRKRIENIIAAHRAGGGSVLLSTHSTVALPGSQNLVLDAFAAARG
jgi:heme exporter protein A